MKSYYLIFMLVLKFTRCLSTEIKSPKIAIVGAGIGGASAAHFLHQQFPESELHVFDRASQPGGRLKLVEMDGQHYEIGGTIIHPRNFYMLNFTSLLGLKHREPETKGLMAIVNGEEVVFQESEYSLITLARMVLRYGLISLMLCRSLVSSMLDNFSRIYSAQDQGLAFTSVAGLLDHMDPTFPGLTQQQFQAYLEQQGFSEPFISELAAAASLVNYGQNNLGAFVGTVSLAGAQEGLWSVKGGNFHVAEGLLKKSGASFHPGMPVTHIALLPNGSFSLTSPQGVEVFDLVLLATPVQLANITFSGFPSLPSHGGYHNTVVTAPQWLPHHGGYHTTVATAVRGELNLTRLGLKPSSGVNSVLNCDPASDVTSVGQIAPVLPGKSTTPVWKVFSPQPLSHARLQSLFSRVEESREFPWLAYPQYFPLGPLPSFILHPHLYHLNAIEWAASAMEMSAISGRNAALLARHLWYRDFLHLVDQPSVHALNSEL